MSLAKMWRREAESRVRRNKPRGSVFTARGENLDTIGALLNIPRRPGTLDLVYRRTLISECFKRAIDPTTGSWQMRMVAQACGLNEPDRLSFDDCKSEIQNVITKWDVYDDYDDDERTDRMDDAEWEGYDHMTEPSYVAYDDEHDYASNDLDDEDDRYPNCARCGQKYMNCGCKEFSP